MLTDQRVQPRHPGDPLRQPGPSQPPPRPVLQLHIMVIFSPVVPGQQHISSVRSAQPSIPGSVDEDTSGLMDQCSRQPQQARHPISGLVLLTSSGGTV
jgi:hypothetical protein